MIVKRMVVPDDVKVRRYTSPLELTPGLEDTMTSRDVQERAIRRAEELAHARNYMGAGRFEQIDYEKALSELSPEERALERGFGPVATREPSQAQRASKHHAERIVHLTQMGYSRSAAVEKARAEERRTGLDEVRAAVPHTPWSAQDQQHREDGARAFSLAAGSRIGGEMVRDYEAGPGVGETLNAAKRAMSRDTLVRALAASVLYRGGSVPDARERSFADSWFEANFPPPAPVPGAGPGTVAGSPPGSHRLDGYNKERERFLESVMQGVRAVLRDPAQRQQLRPGPLGP